MLLYFVLGALFMLIGVPLLQALVSIVSAWSESIVYKFALKVYKIKEKMNLEDQEDQENNKKIPMGFQTEVIGTVIEDPEYEEEQEEEQ